MAVRDLNRAKYTGLDFATHNDNMLARLQAQFASDFNDFAVSSMGIVLLDLVSFSLDTLSFYVDRRASDLYLSTARTRSSVAKTTRQLGYKMRGAITSSVDLAVNLKKVYAFAVTIPQGFQFKGPNNTVWEATQPVTFPANTPITTVKPVTCYEGETLGDNFTSNGSENQTYRLGRIPAGKQLVSGSVKVKVNGADWTEQDMLVVGLTDQFEVLYNETPPAIRFGDNVTGNVPPNAATITTQYVASKGLQGQISKGTVTASVNTLTVMFQSIELNITNLAASTPGADAETPDHAAANAPAVWNSRDAAVTKSDYEALSGAFANALFGRVAVAHAVTDRSASTDTALTTQENNIVAAITAVTTPVSTNTALLAASATALAADAASLQTIANTIQTKADSAYNAAVIGVTANTAVKVASDEAGNAAARILGVAGPSGTGRAYVDGLSTMGGVLGVIHADDKAAIEAYLDTIKTNAQTVNTQTAAITTQTSTLTTQLASIESLQTDIGTVTSGPLAASQVYAINQTKTDVAARGVTVAAAGVAITTSITGASVAITDAVDAIHAHVDRILANDCKANLITVPILSKDRDGFYAAPSAGLRNALQEHLDARKDLTHTVEVVDGSSALVKVVVSLRLGVFAGFSAQTVSAAVQDKADTLLKDRKFGESLYESDIEATIFKVDGLGYVNVEILGYLASDGVTVLTDLLDDVCGNLIIKPTQVITKGYYTVVTELSDPRPSLARSTA